MSRSRRIRFTFAAAIVVAAMAHAQPNPYRAAEGWAKLPDGRTWGSTSAVEIDRNGHIWTAERCGANTCAGSNIAPVVELDP